MPRDQSPVVVGSPRQAEISVQTEFEADLHGLYLASLAGHCEPPSKCLAFFGAGDLLKRGGSGRLGVLAEWTVQT